MWTRFEDFDRTFSAMDQLRRRMDRLFEEFEPARTATARDSLRSSLLEEAELALGRGRIPRLRFFDSGPSLIVRTDLPGVSEKDLQVSLHQDVLTLAGERKPDAPVEYFVHRQERAPVKFARSYTLPIKVEPEKCAASMKNGVLTITLTKVPEAQPQQITVKAQ